MTTDQLLAEINASAVATFALVGPLLAAAAVLGLLIAIFQAATQIQEQTLSPILKIILISAGLVASGSVLVSPLVQYSEHVLNDFPDMVK